MLNPPICLISQPDHADLVGFNRRFYSFPVKDVGYLYRRCSIDVHIKDSLYCIVLVIIYTRHPSFEIIITINLADFWNSKLEALSHSPSHVLTDWERLFLGEGRKDCNQQFRAKWGCAEVLLLKVHTDAILSQVSNRFKQTHCIPGESGNRLHKNKTNLSCFCIINHLHVFRPLFSVGLGLTLIGINADLRPFRVLWYEVLIGGHMCCHTWSGSLCARHLSQRPLTRALGSCTSWRAERICRLPWLHGLCSNTDYSARYEPIVPLLRAINPLFRTISN